MSDQLVYGENPRDLDQFFTKPDVVQQCINFFHQFYKLGEFDLVIEPSSGNNDFVRGLQQYVTNDKLIWMDIDSIDEEHNKNFMLFEPPPEYEGAGKRILTIGNPPFGKNSSKAILFFNRAACYSDVIAFIVPKTFRKQSFMNRLFCTFVLVGEMTLAANSFIFEGEDYNIECIFQVWKKTDVPRKSYKPRKETVDFMFVNDIDDYDIAVRRVGVNAGRIYEDKTKKYTQSSHLFIKIKHEDPLFVVKRLKDLSLETCTVKYNTAGNPSLSANEICCLYDEAYNNYEQSFSSNSNSGESGSSDEPVLKKQKMKV